MNASNHPYIPETAPFNNEQRAWLNGLLAGLFSTAEHLQGIESATKIPVTILFGSQTGTSESLAKKTAKQLKAINGDPKVVDLGDFTPEQLSECETVLLITSTYGEGEPPDNARAFHKALLSDKAPRLKNLRYSVLGLGDSSYADFCQCSKELDQRLEALGAKRFADMVECDGDPDEPFAQWLEQVKGVLGDGTAADDKSSEPVDEKEENSAGYDKKNPFPATLLKTINLNKEGSAKATHHIELSLEGSGLAYEVGDALGVYPENNARLIDEIIAAAGFQPDEPTALPDKSTGTLFDALRYYYDVGILTEAFLRACGRLTSNAEIKEIIADEAAMKNYIDGRGLVDPILEFGVKFPTTEYLIAPLKTLKPRLYSISSSPKTHPGEVHLTVGKVVYDAHGRKRFGVCSSYLADHQLKRPVKVYLHANKAFRLTEKDDVPVIMIGPGTGIAPFRAFLEEREARKATGANWLFFGDQHQATDFLYQTQLTAWQDSGFLTRLSLAFSRDQEAKVYVQDRMRESAKDLFKWLDDGAYLYVCGDASRMAKDVDRALHDVIETAGGLSPEEAEAYIDNLKREKRYLRDVY